jgi:PAS domain S-box-containing protein
MPGAGVPPRPLSSRIVVGFATALAILMAIGLHSYRSTLGVVESAAWVAHTHEVVSHLWSLSSDVVTVESRRRAYALTGDEEQVERAHASGASANENLERLRHLTADNPRQQERLDRLDRLVAGRLARVEESVDRLRHAPADRASQAEATTAASRANDEIRSVIREMLDEESALRDRRHADVQASLRRTKWVITLGGVSAGLLVGLASFFFYRESHHRQRAEAELRRREALYRAVLSQFPNGAVLLFDRELRYRLAEGQGLAMVGLSKAGLEGHTIWEALPPETCAAIEPAYRAALGGQATSFEVPFRGRHYAVQVSPLATEGHETLGMVVTQDITERRRAEDEVRRLNTELYAKILETTSANQELEAFSYSVSHDLRAPIRHINGFVDMLQRRSASALDETAQRHLNTIARASRHMGQLIDDLLAFSRMGRGELTRNRVSLGSLAREVIEAMRPELDGRSIEWRVDGLPDVTGDAAMLRVVLGNLLSNAVKYTRPRAQAVIEIGAVAAEPGEVVLFVKDNGVGFDMQYADKLFGVFQRLHRSDEFEGTGIGLATVRRIVHRHGGRTWAEASLGGGATFFVALPAREQESHG